MSRDIAVVCTGKRTHKRTRITTISARTTAAGVATFATVATASWRSPGEDAINWYDEEHAQEHASRSSYRARCPRCGLNPKIGEAHWEDIVRRVVSQKAPVEIDLSYLQGV